MFPGGIKDFESNWVAGPDLVSEQLGVVCGDYKPHQLHVPLIVHQLHRAANPIRSHIRELQEPRGALSADNGTICTK